jgi:threonine/homoserine/homoserine lactone efflux protein
MNVIFFFIKAFLLGLSGAVMPGPLLTVDINESFRRGYKAGPLLVLGHGLLELLLILGFIFGLDTLLIKPLVKGCVALVGGLVLFWMGGGMVREAWQNRVTLELTTQGVASEKSLILMGALVSMSNPYWILWWVTVGIASMTLPDSTLTLLNGTLGRWEAFFVPGIFLTGHLLADLVWYSGVSFLVVKGKKVISDQAYCVIIIICGIFLIYFAVSFIWSGINFLWGR